VEAEGRAKARSNLAEASWLDVLAVVIGTTFVVVIAILMFGDDKPIVGAGLCVVLVAGLAWYVTYLRRPAKGSDPN
jgi:hypothetical protein